MYGIIQMSEPPPDWAHDWLEAAFAGALTAASMLAGLAGTLWLQISKAHTSVAVLRVDMERGFAQAAKDRQDAIDKSFDRLLSIMKADHQEVVDSLKALSSTCAVCRSDVLDALNANATERRK